MAFLGTAVQLEDKTETSTGNETGMPAGNGTETLTQLE